MKAVFECFRNKAPPPPKGTPLQQTATWLGPPSNPPLGADANPPWQWCARERALIQAVEDYLERIEHPNAAISELQHSLLSPEDDACCILKFVENVCDGRRRKKFEVLETKRGVEVAEKG